MPNRFNIDAMVPRHDQRAASLHIEQNQSIFPPDSPAGGCLLTRARLAHLLGAPATLFSASQGDMDEGLTAARLTLTPGDVLYAQGSLCHYVYVLESGLLECVRTADQAAGEPGSVSFVGPREWLGLHERRDSCA